MQFPNMDEEESDFNLSTAARSRLSSLFQGESASGDVNQALTFQAPKQPRKNDNTQNGSGTFKLIHAAAVHAYKLMDGNYVNQGKLGCAILGIHEHASYKFLLYKGKQVQVTSCSIVPNFKFHVQANNYVNFYDEKNENWSLNFDSETALIDFAKQIALAKANSEGKTFSTLVIQDLVLGEGPSLDVGHSAEVRYTGWLLSNHSFGQIFDSNIKSESAFRLRLGKSKVIKGWTEGLVGAQKGCKRLLVVPPSLAYGPDGMGPSVPPNSTLIFDVLVTKVKISRESSHSPSPIKMPENATAGKPDVPPRSSISQEDNIRMRGASISEQLTQSPKKDKAQLISRMAKMGTATLPLQGAVPAQVSSDSENEEEEPREESPPVQLSGSGPASPKTFSKPNSRHNSVSSAVVQPLQSHPVQESCPLQVTQHSSQISLYSQAALPTPQAYMGPHSGFPPYQPQLASPFHVPQPQFQMQNIPGMMPPTSMADTHLPLLITETRSQNTEVRLSLSKITDKVDTVIQKVDDLRLQQGRGVGMSHAAYMDSTLIVQNIERIVQENNQLKEDAEVKNTKIQTLNEKICDLLQRNQGFFEESNSMLEQRSDSIQAVSSQSQTKLLNLEKEKAKLSFDLSDATSKLSVMEAEFNQLRSRESQLKQRLLEYEKSGIQAEGSNVDYESLVNSLRDQVRTLNNEKNSLSVKLEELEKQVKELSISNASLLKETSSTHQQNNETKMLKNEKEEILREKDELLAETEKLKRKLKAFESSEEDHKKKLRDLQAELEDSLSWRKEHEVLYEKTCAVKEKYKSRIVQLISEMKQLQAAGSDSVSSDFSGEIKKVMNALYKLLQGKFEPNTSYSGSKVLEMTLQTIRGLTFQMLQMKSRASSNSSEQDVESESKGNPSASEHPSAENEQSGNSDGEGVISVSSAQQNGLGEEIGHSDSEGQEIASVLEVPVNVESVPKMVDQSKNGDCDHETLVSNSSLVASDSDRKCADNNLDASNSVLENHTTETLNTQKDSKEVIKAQIENRISPDSSQHLPSSNPSAVLPSGTEGNKIWKPQPPPLFDDDDDDDDDWLK